MLIIIKKGVKEFIDFAIDHKLKNATKNTTNCQCVLLNEKKLSEYWENTEED